MKFVLFLLIISSPAFSYDWSDVKDVINNAIKENTLPGGVLIVGNKKEILLQEAFGTTDANADSSSLSTIYDLASLTKIVATTTSIMILEEQGKLSLQDKISKYFPEFTGPQKDKVTIEEVMRHQSGISAWAAPKPTESLEEYVQRFLRAPLTYEPGSKFAYSDLGFILLAQLVQKITLQPIEEFAMKNIFVPLEMNSTYYHVPDQFNHLCAPTFAGREKCLPHDPIAFRFSPLRIGNAGVFSTAENVSHLVQMYLNQGTYKNKQFLKKETVKKMITLPLNEIRGLGFDLLSPYAEMPRGKVYPKGISYGHTGYTGTTIWVDPSSGSYLIFLSNRVWLGDELTSKKFSKLRFDIATAVGRQFYSSFFHHFKIK